MTDWHILLDGSTLPSRDDVGNKARGVALMRHRGLPVPLAFVLPTEVGRLFNVAGALPDEAWEATINGIAEIAHATGRSFGGSSSPLLVSVRSGAAQSMPGMMDTILNLGINDAVEAALAAESGDAAFARDTHCRFIVSYAKTVLRATVEYSEESAPADVRAAARKASGQDVPEDPHEQLRGAICAVFSSWSSPRAKAYRRHWKIPEEGGTAVTVQAMVFGNLDEDSGTGVFFTRNPHSGEPEPYGEFLPRGQGEDVVSGEIQPLDLDTLRQRMPDVYAALLDAGRALEQQAGDVQDVEFTVEKGRLYLLQTRNAKRSHQAAVRLAVELVHDGLSTPEAALKAVQPAHVEAVLQPGIDPEARASARLLGRGEPACPGIASGLAVGDADEAQRIGDGEHPVILVRRSTSPEDVHGMIAARGVCTEIGGRTSHAAVVSRELGRPAVVGCGEGTLQDVLGQVITIDGSTGEVFAGELKTTLPDVSENPYLAQLVAWVADYRHVLADDHPLIARAERQQPPATADK